MKRVFLASIIALFLTNCYSVIISGNATLVPKSPEVICQKVAEKRIWYAVWGLIPIGDNSTNDIIPKNRKVRVETKMTPLDIIINMVLSNFSIVTTTAEVYVCE